MSELKVEVPDGMDVIKREMDEPEPSMDTFEDVAEKSFNGYSHCCRLCLRTDSVFSIFTDALPDLPQKIASCVSVAVNETDRLPTFICTDCVASINTWQHFKNVCDESQAKLQEWHDRNYGPTSELLIKSEPHEDYLDDPDTSRNEYDQPPIKIQKLEANQVHFKWEKSCYVCYRKFSSRFSAARHEINIHAYDRSKHEVPEKFRVNEEGTKNVKCIECDVEFDTDVLLIEHEKDTHNFDRVISQLSDDEGETVEQFKERNKYILEMMRNGNECGYCKRKMAHLHSLISHLRVVHHMQIPNYQCFQCCYSCTSRQHISAHNRTEICKINRYEFDKNKTFAAHDVRKPIECALCPGDNFEFVDDCKEHVIAEHFLKVRCACKLDAYESETSVKIEMDENKSNVDEKPDEIKSEIGDKSDEIDEKDKKESKVNVEKYPTIHDDYNKFVAHFNERECEFICVRCDDIFIKMSSWEDHDCYSQVVVQIEAVKPYRGYDYELVSVNDDKTEITCETCNESFKTEDNLKTHTNLAHNFTCATCPDNEPYKTIDAINEHMQTKHDNANERIYACSMCAEKYENNPQTLLDHLKTDHAPKYKCEICVRDFVNEEDLEKHMRRHNQRAVIDTSFLDESFRGAKKSRKLQCSNCLEPFAEMKRLVKHKKVHNVDADNCHTCQYCPAQFRFSNRLYLHKRVMHMDVMEPNKTDDDPCEDMAEYEDTGEFDDADVTDELSQDEIDPMSMMEESMVEGDGGKYDDYDDETDPSQFLETSQQGFMTQDSEDDVFGADLSQTGSLPECVGINEDAMPDADQMTAFQALRLSAVGQDVNKYREKYPNAVQCDICFKWLANTAQLYKHRKYTSCQYGKQYQGNHVLNIQPSHFLSPKLRSFWCEYCSKAFDDNDEYMEHMKSLHPDANPKTHWCDICDKTFLTAAALVSHKKSHLRHPLMQTKSPSPPVAKPTPNDILPTKLNTISGGATISIACKYCPAKFQDRDVFQTHLEMHRATKETQKELLTPYIAERGYWCEVCSKSFPTTQALSNHKRIHFPKKNEHYDEQLSRFVCNVCQKSFTTNSALGNHRKVHLPPVARRPNNMSNAQQQLRQRQLVMQRQMQMIARQQQFKPQNIESKYGSVSIVNINALKNQGVDVKQEPMDAEENGELDAASLRQLLGAVGLQQFNNYNCEICDKNCLSGPGYASHRKMHEMRGELPVKVKCPICGQVYDSRISLANHMRLHKNRNDYPQFLSPQAPPQKKKCTICSQTFTSTASLIAHKKTHFPQLGNSSSPYSVTIKPANIPSRESSPNTSRDDAQTSTFVDVHDNNGPGHYTCTTCNKTYGDMISYKRHARYHPEGVSINGMATEGSKMIVCQVCRGVFESVGQLRRHILNRHNPNGQTPTNQSNLPTNATVDEPTVPAKVYCEYCKVGFSDEDKLRVHMRTYHKIGNLNATSLGNGTTMPIPALIPLSAESTQVYKCNECRMAFKTSKALDNHVEQVHAMDLNMLIPDTIITQSDVD